MTLRPRLASTSAPVPATSPPRRAQRRRSRRYNHSQEYVDLVLRVSAAYAQGEFTQSPDGFSTATVLTSQSNDQTLTPEQRQKAKKAENNANKPKPSKPSGGTGGTPGTGGGTDPGTGGGTAEEPAAALRRPPSGGLSGLVGGLLGDLGGKNSEAGSGASQPATLTWAQAKTQCLASGLSVLDVAKLTKCITGLLS